ncbi:hypothetical protein B0G69_3385 [Paraburkholderia sp. RAU2J]|nr:hypothetical protein B0G69_3385 [Paraburkholderia sp. RAU2J]
MTLCATGAACPGTLDYWPLIQKTSVIVWHRVGSGLFENMYPG